MPPRKQPKGESKVGLVVTLVFFILATLILGYTTYYFATNDQPNPTVAKIAADAEAKANTFKAERDWYKAQASILRAYFGSPPSNATALELMTKDKADIDKYIATKSGKTVADDPQGKAWPDKDEVFNLLAKLNKDMPWDASREKVPTVTVESRLKQLEASYAALEKSANDIKAARDTAERRAKDAEELQKDKEKNHRAEVDKLRENLEKDRAADRKQIKDLLALVSAKGEEKENEVKEKADLAKKLAAANKDKAGLEAQLSTLKKDKAELTTVVENTQAKLASVQVKAGIDPKAADAENLDAKAMQALKNWRKDWKIIAMDREGRMPYVNLGTADRVVPQLTFSIHSVGLDGRLNPIPKGTLEIIYSDTVNPHVSRARITSVRDPKADPIVKGDALFNPTWDPNVRKHVAIVGIIDLNGDGRDTTTEFIRTLERQGTVVDSYMDTKELKQVGKGLGINTDYLIVGDGLDASSDPRGRTPDLVNKMDRAIQAQKDKARANGVTVIGFHKYMDLTGYRPPHMTDSTATRYGKGPGSGGGYR